MSTYKCFSVDKSADGFRLNESVRSKTDLSVGKVRVRIDYSSLNYKDALAATGHPGVALKLPLVPGIDAAGDVVESNHSMTAVGQKVIIAHEHFGTKHDGGWQEFVEVPGDWTIPLPDTLSPEMAMAWGTAGFTAAQSVLALEHNSVYPDKGPVVVTGASGGVGVCAVMLLKKLGYQVVAVSGKLDRQDWLKEHGASEVVSRSDFIDQSSKPMLSAKYAGAVDTVGGQTLVTVIKSMQRGGCVTACGNVGGVDIPLTVFPFILRGVNLQGIDSAGIEFEERRQIWNRIAGNWNLPQLAALVQVLNLNDVSKAVTQILAGMVAGRTVIKVSDG